MALEITCTMDFQISADMDQFSDLFGTLAIERVIADGKPGYPCRVSLQDAEIGEKVLL